ncbi:hypothetical protein D1871_00350 [Nakamurella silvestris]|nr:hypothetical protein D1871_00350 [Nakamurella silvestris]
MSAPLALTLPLAVLPALVGGFAAYTASRGWAGTLTRDGRFGVRSPAAVRSEAAFITANKVAAPVVAGAAVVGLLVAVLVVVLPLATVTAVIVAVLGLVGSATLLVYSGVLGDRAAQTVPKPATKPGTGAGCGGCACGGGGCGGGSGLTKRDPAAVAGN